MGSDETNADGNLQAGAAALREAVEQQVLGQEAAIETLLASYLAGGHALIEGVPGLGKTLMARSFAAAVGADFRRIQFTPDLMPADVVGTNVFNPREGSFSLVRGPVFTDILMADEINRAPPKTQAALLESMQEKQVTIDGATHRLADGFFVIATQNPLELEGVYPLPEAQLDRFLVRVDLGLPAADAEREIVRRAVAGEPGGWSDERPSVEPVVTPAQAAGLRSAGRRSHVSDELIDYLLALAEAVRASPHVELGVSPRGVLALLEMARAGAFLDGRDFVTPDDFKRFLVASWGHRLLLTAEAELEGHSARSILDSASAAVEVPH